MNFAELLAARMTESEKILMRMSVTESQLIARYHDFKRELSGGPFKPGTEEDGIAEIKQVRAIVSAEFQENASTPTFTRGWKF